MKDFRADLHCHTTCSDGTFSPKEIVAHAKKCGLLGLSITDHDTVNAYKEAIPAVQETDLVLGSGVEFSTVNESLSVHILGYDFDIENTEILTLCKRHIKRRLDRNQKIMEKLAQKGMKIDSEKIQRDVEAGHPSGRPHIAQELVDKGHVESIQQAFNQWIGDKKPCFDPGIPITTDETIEIIHHAGGKVFIAHPHLIYHHRDVVKLLEKPIDGIEAYYAKFSPNQENKWIEMAREKNLLISGGSDFHGSIKPNNPLGCSWVNQQVFDQIFQKHRWH